MARGDVQISLETNDLKIEKSKSNTYAENSFRVDTLVDAIVVSLVIPKEYSDGFSDSDSFDWRDYAPAARELDKIDTAHNSKVVRLEYIYVDGNNLTIPIAEHPVITYGTVNTVEFLTVLEYNLLIDEAILTGDDFIFSYATQTSVGNVTSEFFSIKPSFLGDFVVDDYIPQNEYILLNANEGSFLQAPLQGVGLSNYLQSPSSEQQLIDKVVEKFANDALRVLGIQKNGDNLTIETEDYNK